MVRRTHTQLVETIERSRVIYLPLGAKYNEQRSMWTFPNKARLRFAYLERDSDADSYQGHSYTRVYVEEAGTFPSAAPILKLMATLRSGAGVPCGFRATGNPGGPGHQWVKARYIDPAPQGWKIITSKFKNPWTNEELVRERVFIPSKLQDNRYLGSEYVANLQMTGSEQLVKAWLEGDWNVIDGAFFDGWNSRKHVVRPFAVPSSWLRFRSMDWGYATPFSVGWWAVCDNDTWPDDGSSLIPRGALVRYREWYGCEDGKPNVGLRLTPEEVADGIVEREREDGEIRFGVLDPSAFAHKSGPSEAERINSILVASKRTAFQRADNTRVSASKGHLGGWNIMRQRLRGDGEYPGIFCFETCLDSIRTIPVLQHDPDRAEDLNTEQEDHAADDWRYACMSRPWIPTVHQEPKPTQLIFTADSQGRITPNMSVYDAIMLKKKRRERQNA
jgi:hypothetical protein